MGNAAPGPSGLNEEEQTLARENYLTRVALTLGAKRLPEKERTLVSLFSVEAKDNGTIPQHYATVTHGFAWIYGTEFVVRYFADDDAAAATIDASMGPILSMILSMQETTKFRTLESCEVLFQVPFNPPSQGTHGAVIVEDTLLKGTLYKEDEFPEDGPLCDALYWPQHFLGLAFLRPVDYSATHGVPMRSFVDILKMRSPFLINDFSLGAVAVDPTTASALVDLKMSAPSRCGLTGMSMDLRVRKNGHEVDIVVGGRWLAPILNALQEAFDKPTVPKGTVVSVEDEKSTCLAQFECHDSEGEVITAETAHFVIQEAYFMKGDDIETNLGDADRAAYVQIPAGVLWENKQLIRRIEVCFYLPADLMARMIEDVRAAVFSRRDDSNMDAAPIALEWPESFVGKNGQSGFGPSFGTAANALPGRTQNEVPDRLRFICAGMEYFEDELAIDDEGSFYSTC